VVAPRAHAAEIRRELRTEGYTEAASETAEAWRIIEGIPKMGADFDRRSTPAEAGLDPLIDTTKGCFLGQESVARVRNLGHPPRVLRHVRGQHLAVGASVLHDGSIAGEVTSATQMEEDSIALVRVAWSAADTRLTDTDGHPLLDVATTG
jgi:folate-binding protein YgfZ